MASWLLEARNRPTNATAPVEASEQWDRVSVRADRPPGQAHVDLAVIRPC
jgi:hypothetical protein